MKIETKHNGSIVTATHIQNPGNPLLNAGERGIELTSEGHDSDPFDCWASVFLTTDEATNLAQFILDAVKEPPPDPNEDLKQATPEELLEAMVYLWKWGRDGRKRTEYNEYILGLKMGLALSQPGGWKNLTPNELADYRSRTRGGKR